MTNHKVSKLENPERLAELDPGNTLTKIGFKDNMTLCDIGAGSGIFSFPAAKISNGIIYALEASDEMIEVLESRKNDLDVNNLQVKKVESDQLPLGDALCDMAIMVTVLHELENKSMMLQEIRRILKRNGRLAVIEFHKGKTPLGAPLDHRISEEKVTELCREIGMNLIENYRLGDNFYCLTFQL